MRPLARTVLTHSTQHFPTKLPLNTAPASHSRSILDSIRPQPSQSSLMSRYHELHSLTETRHPKRRPGFKNRRKRASLKPPGPYAWVPYTPGQPILANNPNAGSIKRRNERKRIGQRKAFIKSEAKKRKVQVQEAKKKKIIKRVERKMAAVARDREWALRLAELQQLEAEKATKA